MMSQRKSQRGKKIEDVVEDLKKDLLEFRNQSEKEVKYLKNMLENMQVERKSDMENYKRCQEGWESEYKIRLQVVEELDKSEMEKNELAKKLVLMVNRWNEFERNVQIFSEMRKNSELNRRVEDLECTLGCWGNSAEKEGKEDKQTNNENQNALAVETEKASDEVRGTGGIGKKSRNVYEMRDTRWEMEESVDKGNGVDEGNEQLAFRKEPDEENCENAIGICDTHAENSRVSIMDGAQNAEKKKKVLLIGDVNNKIAREFCQENSFGAWILPGIDIVGLTNKIKKSRRVAEEEPGEVVLYVGRSDISRNDRTEIIIRDLKTLLQTAKERYGNKVKVSICKWSNNIGDYLNKQFVKVCDEENVRFIKINPSWEMVGRCFDSREMRCTAIGKALRKTLLGGQVFHPRVFWWNTR